MMSFFKRRLSFCVFKFKILSLDSKIERIKRHENNNVIKEGINTVKIISNRKEITEFEQTKERELLLKELLLKELLFKELLFKDVLYSGRIAYVAE